MMIYKHHRFLALVCFSMLATAGSVFGKAGGLKFVHGHVPKLPAGLSPKGQLAPTRELHLAIGLPMRDSGALDVFLAQLYDPASTNFHRFLSPDEFTSRFGPTTEDYQAVMDFARTNGLVVSGTYDNRLVLDVSGPAERIQRAFHVTLRTYKHPTQERDFFAPDVEPSVDVQLPIADISGLNNFVLPHPKLRRMDPAPATGSAVPRTGSSPTGSYMGKDFRAAYLPGVSLTGTGQMVGLLQFDGFYQADITAYETAAGLPNVPVQTVLLDAYNGVPTSGANSGNNEVSLDIEMVISMAPGLSKVVVFEAGPNGTPNDILNSMAANSQIKQFSCSWGWGGGPSTTTDNIFKQMAAQGQAFFAASGDSDAFTPGASSANGVDNATLANTPASSPYITVVGGTTLSTTGPGGAWSSETVWNWGSHNGSYVGSSGGVSSHYPLPAWQSGISMTSNGGSTTQRNVPDVAMTADNVYVIYGNGSSSSLGGTSCAAPLWAGLAALANEQAVSAGKAAIGFFNPAIYDIGKGADAGASFHDTTTGNNFWNSSPNLYSAA
ncbi:MAG TPA: S53 family peptidase, partial [Verrucomicrobiae bacterium]|nr:S53 family peptidase [Verrucomicrobiae bacterium]